MRFILSCLLMTATAHWTLGARILAVLPVTGKSHHNMFEAILKTLAERGHQIVNYTPFPHNKPIANYQEIYLDGIEKIDKTMTQDTLKMLSTMSPIGAIRFLWSSSKMVEDTFKNVKIKELLQSNEKFDLIFLEAFFAQEALLGFGHKFNAPVVALQPFGSFNLINKASGNSLALSYIPDFSFSSSDHMSFYERFLSSYSILSTLLLYYSTFLPSQQEYMQSVFKDPTMPHLTDMIHNISLFVNNAHPNIHYSQPYTPNIIPVGGIHLSRDHNLIPPAMMKFIDEAKHGVIYFSLGSVLPDHLLPQEYFDNFINAFRRLPQRVLWKTGSDLDRLPENIMIAKWMPQQDILAHPNVVLFMTHGGIFGQHEAINAGVPVICIPFFGDQPMNAKFYETRGIGISLPFDTISEETIYSSITTVLNNPKYKENMEKLSHIYRDRPMSPADTLVFWVEYVLRHKGAQHLRPVSANLSWYQLALLDIIAAIITTVILALIVINIIIRKILSFISRRRNISVTLSTKKKD